MSTSDKIKLRNKKTGKVKEFDVLGCFMLSDDYPNLYTEDKTYSSLAELNEEWEDCKGPIIKNKKVRKAVRAWAEANGFDTARYSSVNDCFCHQGNMMFVEPSYELEQLDSLGYKTIAELCGEEEE